MHTCGRHSFLHQRSCVEGGIQSIYKDINVQSGATIFYLGLQSEFNKKKHSVKISQPGYVEDLLKEFTVERTAATPATVKLFDTTEDATPIDSTSFALKLIKLSFLAKWTRPDLLLAVSFLASRMKYPNHLDDRKLQRVYEYLSGILFHSSAEEPSHYFVDGCELCSLFK